LELIVIREVVLQTQTFPVHNDVINSTNDGDDEDKILFSDGYESQQDQLENKISYLSAIFAYIINRRNNLLGQELELDSSNFKIGDIYLVNTFIPRIALDIDNLKVVRFSEDLVYGLKLSVNYKNFLASVNQNFDSDVTYNEDEGLKFRRLIMERKGYLDPEENYFYLKDNLLSEGTKVTTLINTRVLLFWRGIELSEYIVKRTLSLGLLYLIKRISYAELIFEIYSLLPNGRYNVSVKSVDSSYVLIGIELPIF
jgi:hypothetical protein